MNASKIALFTDTGANTPEKFIKAFDIRVAPLRISYSDGSTYESGVNITAAQLVARLADEVPKTSLPSPETIRQLFVQAKEDGYECAVFVTISSGLSATYQTACMVASQFEDFPVAVVDSRSIGVAAGMVVIQAGRLIEEGVPFGALKRRLEDLAARTWVFFSTKTLEYLRLGGRISEPVYRLGSMLDIKPVIMCNESGHYVVARKARGWERSLDTEVSLVRERARRFKVVRLAISCSEGNDHFAELEAKLRHEMDELGVQVAEVVYAGVSPDLLVHTGPDMVGIGIQGIS